MVRLIVGAVGIAIMAGAGLLAVVWTPFPVDSVAIAQRLQGPSATHLLGTDQFGRDVLSMLMAGAQTSLGVATGAVAIGVLFGVPIGLLSASVGGIARGALMRANDLVFAFPALITAAILTALTSPTALNAMLAIGVFNIPVFARITAGSAQQILALDFIDVARLAGKGRMRIAGEHVLPNLAPLIATQAATQFAVAVLAEAGLSYVGLGAQPPAVSWGRMLAEAQTLVFLEPLLAVWPGLAIAAAVFSVSLLGEGLRMKLDPRTARYAAA